MASTSLTRDARPRPSNHTLSIFSLLHHIILTRACILIILVADAPLLSLSHGSVSPSVYPCRSHPSGVRIVSDVIMQMSGCFLTGEEKGRGGRTTTPIFITPLHPHFPFLLPSFSCTLTYFINLHYICKQPANILISSYGTPSSNSSSLVSCLSCAFIMTKLLFRSVIACFSLALPSYWIRCLGAKCKSFEWLFRL